MYYFILFLFFIYLHVFAKVQTANEIIIRFSLNFWQEKICKFYIFELWKQKFDFLLFFLRIYSKM